MTKLNNIIYKQVIIHLHCKILHAYVLVTIICTPSSVHLRNIPNTYLSTILLLLDTNICFDDCNVVSTRVLFGCSLSPLHFICSVQASTVTNLLQQLLTLLSVIHVTHVIRWCLYFISLNMISLWLVYMCVYKSHCRS